MVVVVVVVVAVAVAVVAAAPVVDGDPIIIGDVTLEELKANDLLILPFKLDIELIEFLGDKDCEFLDKLRGRNDCTE